MVGDRTTWGNHLLRVERLSHHFEVDRSPHRLEGVLYSADLQTAPGSMGVFGFSPTLRSPDGDARDTVFRYSRVPAFLQKLLPQPHPRSLRRAFLVALAGRAVLPHMAMGFSRGRRETLSMDCSLGRCWLRYLSVVPMVFLRHRTL